MRGIVLAGGMATRLYPVTKGICKQMLPIYDKPMIYYSLSVLMLAGIREVLIISTPRDTSRFKELLGDGSNLGIRISYSIQKEPKGIAQAFIIGADFIGNDKICLILGDNIFFGHNLTTHLQEAASLKKGAIIFGYYVRNPERYGVIEFDKKCRAVRIEEKPKRPKSKWVATGLYFYDNQVVRIAKNLSLSKRGELEITDINNEYIKKRELKVILLGRGYAWLDAGTFDSLIDASIFIKTIEERQGLKIGCIEEIAYKMKFISKQQLKKLAQFTQAKYSEYLLSLLKEKL